ncbi:hypothetical protein [uncultured Aliiroseovarius sp.]|uniref:hypothetical protein n=1 Tax=uncultured Aliiroseovarius sp. TaxID=1658783 RepID=UPI0026061A82|nr:hypothetical protein [uncultured Aliiroseovarius sp.]
MNIQEHVPIEEAGHWMDMIFAIAEVQISNEDIRLGLEAETELGAVGLQISFPRYWSGAGEDFSQVDFKSDSIAITRIADRSSRLVSWMKAWSAAHPIEDDLEPNAACDPSKRRPEFTFTGAFLGAEDVDLTSKPGRIKLFYEQECYFEMFLNVDLSSGFVALNEKDTSYREEALLTFENRLMVN